MTGTVRDGRPRAGGPLRVAMVSEFAYPVLGGVSEHVHFLSRGLAARGHDVTVITSNVGDAGEAAALDRRGWSEHGYRTVRLGRSVPVLSNGSISRFSAGLGLQHRLGEALRDADVVHAQGLAPPTLPLFALRSSVAPVTVGTFHTYFDGGHWAYRLFLRYVQTALSRMDRKIAVSDACIQALEPYFPGPYEVIPNGIDTDLYRPLVPGERAPAGPPRILFVGRFDPRNALGDLLEAAARLRREGRDFVVQVVGDGPARPIYEKRARRLGLWDRIEWLGLVNEDRPRLYREATVLAAPCVLASFGVILLEAMASGIPVVCADNIGFRQVIRDGAPGRFVPPHDPAALAAGLAEVLDDPGLRADWGTRGRRVTEERFAWPQVAARIEDLYLEILAEKGRGPAPPRARG
jgi:phosphatidylinositol alpha-mannosyltransferase